MKKTIYIGVWATAFVAGAIFLSLSGKYTVCFSEGFRTFFYEKTYLHDTLFQIGGFASLLADFILQFCTTPFAGCIVCSLVLTLTAVLTDRLLSSITGSEWLIPAAIFPAFVIGVLSHNVNCLFSGVVAMLLMLVLANIFIDINNARFRFLFSIISSIVLFFLAGAVTTLYTVLLLVMELSTGRVKSLRYLALPVIVYLLALISVRLGWSGEMRHLLTPDGYFTPRLKGGSINWLPWTLTAGAFITAELWPFINKGWIKIAVTTLLTVTLAWFGIFKAPRLIDTDNEIFKELSYKVCREDWDGIIGRCGQVPMQNLIRQNCLNIALAEKGVLADQLFKHPCYDIRSIYVQGSRNPYIYTLLSDVYWSMGHAAFSLRYSFEANESLGNYSPRLLKRLVETNEALGYYSVAGKYRRLLSRTLFYRKWALKHETPAVKKNCVFPDNRLCGINGLDDDLKQIVLCNPEHSQTIQYLGSLCLLLRDPARFMNIMETFYGTDALPEVLPTAFQEGVVYCIAGQQELIEKYHISKDVLYRYDQYRQDHRREPLSFWFFINDKR